MYLWEIECVIIYLMSELHPHVVVLVQQHLFHDALRSLVPELISPQN